MDKTPKQPPLSKIRSKIQEFQNIDLNRADLAALKEKISYLLIGHTITTPILMPDWNLFRGTRKTTKPNFVSEISYPPNDKIKTYQRANRPGHAMFYCSLSRDVPFFEIGVKPTEHIVISKWKITEKIAINNVGYHADTFKKLGSNRTLPSWKNPSSRHSQADLIISNFFSDEFSKYIPAGSEYLYKVSAAIAEKLYEGTINIEVAGDNYRGPTEFGGIIYPTIAMKANSDNVALKPHIVDQHLKIEQIEYIRIDKHFDDLKYQVTTLDFADTFGLDGKIEWKGRLPQWQIEPGKTAIVTIENGSYIVRDINGNIINPS